MTFLSVNVLEISYTGDICECKQWLKCWKFPTLVRKFLAHLILVSVKSVGNFLHW